MELNIKQGWLDSHPLLPKIVEIFQKRQIEAYLVGGAVRDLLLGREIITDLDFVVPANGLKIARYVANTLKAAFYPLDQERDTGRVVYETSSSQKIYLDFTSFRGSTLLADLSDRDFTINAIAMSVIENNPQIIDPLKGREELKRRQIKAVSENVFNNDPLRVLRAVRQAASFGFSIEENTQQYIKQASPQLVRVSYERQRDELIKMLNSPAPGQAIQKLRTFEILPHILPELEALIGVTQSHPHYLDAFEHTTAALEAWAAMKQADFPNVPDMFRAKIKRYLNKPLAGNLTQGQLLPLALLLHDSGKPLTRTIEKERIRFLGHERESTKITRRVMNRLRFSSQAISFVEKIVTNHMRPLLLAQAGKVSRRAIYRLFRDTSGTDYQGGIAVILHALADRQATLADKQELVIITDKLIAAYFEQHNQVISPPRLLTGRDLISELKLTEGRLIGLLLRQLKEAQAIGQVKDREAALAFIKTDPDFIQFQANARDKF